MRLVVDTSILIAGLLKPSKVQRILLDPALEFCLPEHALEEVMRHASMMRQRAKLSLEEFDLLLALLTSQMEIVSESRLRPWLSKAQRAISHRDPGDVPFVATAYAIQCDGIWSDDADPGSQRCPYLDHGTPLKTSRIVTTKSLRGEKEPATIWG